MGLHVTILLANGFHTTMVSVHICRCRTTLRRPYQQQEIAVTAASLAFFRQFIPTLTTGSYAASTSTYSTLITTVKDSADGFVLINAKHTPSDGELAEQYNRNDGSPLSARDLTWSYASALTAFAARDGYKPPSWGATDLILPSVCTPNPGPTVSVTFDVRAITHPGGENKLFR